MHNFVSHNIVIRRWHLADDDQITLQLHGIARRYSLAGKYTIMKHNAIIILFSKAACWLSAAGLASFRLYFQPVINFFYRRISANRSCSVIFTKLCSNTFISGLFSKAYEPTYKSRWCPKNTN
eukprot:sb/3475820/